MRILLASSVFPMPPNSGDKNRIHYFLKYLSQHHEIDMVTMFVDGVDDPDEITTLRGMVKNLDVVHINRAGIYLGALMSLAGASPAIVSSYKNRGFTDAIKLRAETRPDVALLYQLRSTTALPHLKDIPIVLDYTDCLYLGYEEYLRTAHNPVKAWWFRREAKLLRWYEAQVGKEVTASCVTSVVDQEGLKKLGTSNVKVIQNGVALPPRMDLNKDQAAMFIGNPAYPPNRQALEFILREVWPSVKGQIPNATFNIVGHRFKPLEVAYEKLAGVAFLGPVPKLETAYAGVSVCLSPVFSGTGIRNKVLEAWAYGKIVVATPKAISGINAESGRDIVIINTATEMIHELTNIFKNIESYELMRSSGRKLVEQQFQWDVKSRSLEQMLEHAVSHQAAR